MLSRYRYKRTTTPRWVRKILEPTPYYLSIKNKPVENELYDIFDIDIATSFQNGFRFADIPKLTILDVENVCKGNKKIERTLAHIETNLNEFLEILWRILERYNLEIIYRFYGLEGLHDVGIILDPRPIRRIYRAKLRYFKNDETDSPVDEQQDRIDIIDLVESDIE